jgi:hypothetical protein
MTRTPKATAGLQRGLLVVAAVAAALSLGGASAQAQTRTWVSGTGDDLNPCGIM